MGGGTKRNGVECGGTVGATVWDVGMKEWDCLGWEKWYTACGMGDGSGNIGVAAWEVCLKKWDYWEREKVGYSVWYGRWDWEKLNCGWKVGVG